MKNKKLPEISKKYSLSLRNNLNNKSSEIVKKYKNNAEVKSAINKESDKQAKIFDNNLREIANSSNGLEEYLFIIKENNSEITEAELKLLSLKYLKSHSKSKIIKKILDKKIKRLHIK
ncbi:hypothetical protein [Apilactobacillus micheneri]|uniref:hypothetical protein n=1 Tax=Apilactobacillus micheneri TaxID=1899430 RepID=UPI001127A33E|nr:hypothetical protein [Apilactobacillus micheneri]TPR41447.1 hypothetical protein DY123_06110 [Apilactobacillus micheneri]TPR48048.1 hypothetical protein DY037_07515 [Apilactobacillus micheneri]TPR51091.1 hypothetical protein DY126_06005 [Apilactobacillus micheneri]